MVLIQLPKSGKKIVKYSPVARNPKSKFIAEEKQQLIVNLLKSYSKEKHCQCTVDIYHRISNDLGLGIHSVIDTKHTRIQEWQRHQIDTYFVIA